MSASGEVSGQVPKKIGEWFYEPGDSSSMLDQVPPKALIISYSMFAQCSPQGPIITTNLPNKSLQELLQIPELSINMMATLFFNEKVASLYQPVGGLSLDDALRYVVWDCGQQGLCVANDTGQELLSNQRMEILLGQSGLLTSLLSSGTQIQRPTGTQAQRPTGPDQLIYDPTNYDPTKSAFTAVISKQNVQTSSLANPDYEIGGKKVEEALPLSSTSFIVEGLADLGAGCGLG